MDERSPYAPPVSDVSVSKERKGTAWKAILFGLLVDIGGTTIFAFVGGMLAVILLTSQGMDEAQLDQLFSERSSPLMIAMTVIGGLFSVLGGYVCARIAKQNELRLAGVMALITSLFNIYFGDDNRGMTLDLLLYAAGIVSVLFGSWLGMRRNQRDRVTP